MVVNPPLHCTRKCGCKCSGMSACSRLQPPCHGSTGRVPLTELLKTIATHRNTHVHLLARRIPSQGMSWLGMRASPGWGCASQEDERACSYGLQLFLGVPWGGPDQLNCCMVAAVGCRLTWRNPCSHISWYNTMGFLPPCGCTWITFCKNSHWHIYNTGVYLRSLSRRRSRRACVRSYVHFVFVCVYMCMCVCLRTCMICIYIHVCMYLYIYAFIHKCMCMCIHICT